MQIPRRHLLGLAAAAALPTLGGCANPLPLAVPEPGGSDGQAQRWLRESAERHGDAAYKALTDINVAYAGRWRALIDRIQPEVVDKPWRAASEERLVPRLGVIAQAHRGPAGRKQVFRRAGMSAQDLGEVSVWYEAGAGQEPEPRAAVAAEGRAGARAGARVDESPKVRTAAALVADCYQLFLLGPLWLADRAERGAWPLALGGRVEVEGRECQWVQAWARPGFGLVALDRVALAIDVADRTTRRMLFTLEGFEGTRGAVAETDTYEHEMHHGVLWPMRSHERVVRPLAGYGVHDWHITGLDVNRGYDVMALRGAQFSGAAAAPAQPRPPSPTQSRP
jgi:hypothetical protein